MKRRPLLTRIRQHFFWEASPGEVLSKIIDKAEYKIYAEIGVWKGVTAEHIAENCVFLKKIYLVDPYDSNIEYKEGRLYKKGEDKTVRRAKEEMLSRTRRFSNIQYVYKTSKEANKDFKDKTLDVVFIDAIHEYNSVKEDIFLWKPKVKRGGIICGHDYNNRYKNHVVRAVDEIFNLDKIMLFDNAIWAVRVN